MERGKSFARKCAVVFDSGIGGLNLLYECAKRTPSVHFYYVSDNANVPYGNRSKEELLSLTYNALKGIENLRPLALVVACNTVTANCIESLRSDFSFPVVGIQPAIKQAVEVGGRCVVLATEATVKSVALKKLAERYGNNIYPIACKDLASYIEKNILDLPPILPQGLLPNVCADSVVLGCTHYSFVKKQIESFYRCPVFDGTGATADHFAKIIGTNNHFSPHLGIVDHKAIKKFKITFDGGNSVLNSQIFKIIFKTNV
ncbi:MAG: glutamate racemase [Candidatus Coproplasma sp.]